MQSKPKVVEPAGGFVDPRAPKKSMGNALAEKCSLNGKEREPKVVINNFSFSDFSCSTRAVPRKVNR